MGRLQPTEPPARAVVYFKPSSQGTFTLKFEKAFTLVLPSLRRWFSLELKISNCMSQAILKRKKSRDRRYQYIFTYKLLFHVYVNVRVSKLVWIKWIFSPWVVITREKLKTSSRKCAAHFTLHDLPTLSLNWARCVNTLVLSWQRNGCVIVVWSVAYETLRVTKLS